MCEDATPVIDYSHQKHWENALIAQGKGSNFIVIYKLDHPFQRADGKKASYELEYRSLSRECEHDDDDNYACVEFQDITYWQAKEINSLLAGIKARREVNVFEHFNLF